ncbi:MAG TPA: protein phosphatase CheZ [Alphaproteobacteria bacterium]|jgi:chemotaxis protein CheZ|nr:protein phosphatase CheZ [Alphaproteobacteria bacterium]
MADRGSNRKSSTDRTSAKADRPNARHAMDIESVVTRMLDSTERDFIDAEIKLYRELAGLARFIQAAKAEIAALSPDDISSTHIPTATNELDAIVGATESATNAIMSAAEHIERLRDEVPGSAVARLSEAVTRIYEACSFQDITGQRITKVVAALKHIDEKVTALIGVLDGEILHDKQAKPLKSEPTELPVGEDVLDGPRRSADTKSQAEIDALLASFD